MRSTFFQIYLPLSAVALWALMFTALFGNVSCGKIAASDVQASEPIKAPASGAQKGRSSARIKNSFRMSGFQLNMAISSKVQVVGCSSGYTKSLTFAGMDASIPLYSSDKNCRVELLEVTLGGNTFTSHQGASFNSSVGAMNRFSSGTTSNELGVQVVSQVTASVGSAEEVEFRFLDVGSGVSVDLGQVIQVGVAAPANEVAEGSGTINFNVTITQSAASPVTVKYVVEGTVSETSDYVKPSGSFVVQPGQSSHILPIELVNDAISESDEVLTLRILGSQPGYVPESDPANVIVNDDDIYLPTAGLVLTYDPQNLVHSSGNVSGWTDSTGSQNASQSNSARQPTRVPQAVNNHDSALFDGNDDFLVVPSHADLNSSTFESKNLVFVIRTGSDVSRRQMLYEQGGGTRGLNVYIDGGSLYVNGWNLASDDATTPWGPLAVSSTVSPNTTYVVRMVYDFSSTAVRMFLNGSLIGEIFGAGRLFSHGAIGLGGSNGNTRFADNTTASGIEGFGGEVLEFRSYNATLAGSEGVALDNFLIDKYAVSVPLSVSIVVDQTSVMEDAGSVQFTVSRNKTESTPLSLTLNASGTATNGADVSTLPSQVTIPAFSKTVDFVVNIVDDAIEEPTETLSLTIPPDAGYQLGSSTAEVSILDNEGYNVPASAIARWRADRNTSLEGSGIAQWDNDLGGLHSLIQIQTADQPTLVNGAVGGQDAALFDGVGTHFDLANHAELNLSTFNEKTLAFAFQTGSDVSTRQFIYEQGGSSKGLNVYIEGGGIYFVVYSGSAYNESISAAIQPDTAYVAIFEFDVFGDEMRGTLNGATLTPANGISALTSHSGGIGVGVVNGKTRLSSGVIQSGGGHFSGYLAEMMFFNALLSGAELSALQTYLLSRYVP